VNSFADKNAKKTTLTLYRPLPFDRSRGELLGADYEVVKGQFAKELESVILPSFGLSMSNVEDIRVTRWGHPVPVSVVGSFAEAKLAKIREPFGDKIFFINQDSLAYPAVETLLDEVRFWTPKVRATSQTLASPCLAPLRLLH
jgi:hypothetical protein